MFKNKSKIIVTLIAVILVFSFSICYADNEVSSNDIMLISQDAATNEVPETENQVAETTNTNTSHSNDVYLFDNDVVVDYVVDGNLFVIGNNVTIKSEIAGDAFILANSITIDGGSIYSNLFARAKNITISGVVYDLYAAANTITINNSGYVYRDIHTTSSSLNIFGMIGRNAYSIFNNISFSQNNGNEEYTQNGMIYGNLQYTSSSDVGDLSSYVSGNVTFNEENIEKASIKSYVIEAITSIVFVLITWLILKWLSPKFVTGSKELLLNKFLPVVGFGILGLIIIPIISFILFMLNITSTFGLFLVGAYILLLSISTAIFAISIAEYLINKFAKNSNFGIELLFVAISSVIIYLLKLIPYVGAFLSFAFVVIGLGIIIKSILPMKKNKETATETKTEK